MEVRGDAVSIPALELLLGAPRNGSTVFLIASIGAIAIPIAHPLAVDAFILVGAGK